jgi:arylsulfatase A-like enzyme
LSLILIVADSMREDVLGCRGSRAGGAPPAPLRFEPPACTPTLDRLAAESVVFDRVISAAPWTVPSIAAMLTGVFSHRLGLAKWEQPFPPEFPTLFARARAAGFTVASFVFDPSHLFRRVPEAGVAGSSQDVAAVLAWLEAHRDEEYFLFLHYWWTHIPYLARATDIPTWRRVTEEVLRALRASPASRDGVKRLYRRAVEQFSEDLLPRVLERVDLGRTHVVITADHGESWGERAETATLGHVFDLHGNALYDEVLRVPLLVRSPDGARGRRVAELVRTVDYCPSLAALLGWSGEPGVDLDGVDLSATFRSGARPPPLEAVSVMNRDFIDAPRIPGSPDELFTGYALTTTRHRLFLEPGTGARRAFDLEADPGELVDLVAARNAPAALAADWRRLEAEVERARVGDFDPGDVAALTSRLQALGYLE